MTADEDELYERLMQASAEGLEPNIRRWLAFRGMATGEPLELQALGIPTGRFPVNRFAHARTIEEAVKLAAAADGWKAPGVYVIGNTVDPAVATRAEPGKWHDQPAKGGGTSDNEIRARKLLYLDFDSARPKGTSATAEQVTATLGPAGRVWAMLGEHLGPNATAIGMSGNGGAVFAALAELDARDSKLDETVKGILAAIKAIYERPGVVEVDTSVCDPKRLMPCFGTVKRKGAPGIAERPHRRTAVLTPEGMKRVDMAALTALLSTLLVEVPAGKRAEVDKAMGKRAVSKPQSQATTSTGSVFELANERCDVRQVASMLGLADGDGVKCPGCGSGGQRDTSVAYVGNGLKCSHSRCSTKGRGSGFRSVVDLVVEVKGMRAGEALRWLADTFGFALPDRRPATLVRQTERTVEQPKFIASPDRLAGERLERLEYGRRTLLFGVTFLDDALGGILPRDVLLVGAKTGVGKTALATVIAAHNAAAGKRVHYFALEAEEREIERRMKFQLVARRFFNSEMFKSGKFERREIRYLDWYRAKLDDVLGPFEDQVDAELRSRLANLKTFYRERSFTSDDFVRKLEEIKTDTDLVILDHLHYVDSDDENENRGYKRTVKQVRDAAIDSGKPVVLVAHVRKGDRRQEPLIPGIEDFHGSSDIPKIATKAVMLAAAFDQPNECPYLWNTYMQVSKCRLDGALTRYAALGIFNSRLNVYEAEYTVGRLADSGRRFEPLATAQLPWWARNTL